MRKGISVTVTPDDRVRLDAIVRHRNIRRSTFGGGCRVFCLRWSRETLYVVEGITDRAQPIRDAVIEELLQGYRLPKDLRGDAGRFKELKKRLLERALGAELSAHLG
jgi:hypothetical protein